MELRCFVSVNIPEDLKQSLGGIIDDLRKSGADAKWVAPDKIHLTLKFLGGTEESLIGQIGDAIKKNTLHYKPFYIKIAGIGCFPSEKRPRVIWVGIEDSDILKDLQKDVDIAMTSFGYAPEDRPFSPHLTLGRIRSPKRMTELMNRLEGFRSIEIGSFEVTGIHVMKSVLKPAGAEYVSLARIPIGTGRNNVE